MKRIRVENSGKYDVLVSPGLLSTVGEQAAALVKGRSAVVISDDKVFPLYGQCVKNSLENAGFQVENFVFPNGEPSKNTDTLISAVQFMAEKQLTRADLVLALGGGVVGDMAGLASGLYLRGLPCVQLPTTLLAAVDSSVGGKTAVNLPAGKNLLGIFSQPALVLCDTDCLQSLTPALRADGFAEVIKYGMIKSAELLDILQSGTADMEEIIGRCVSIKRDVVMADEFDLGERQILNFGHTLGHAIESLSAYSISHGSAVARGMALITRGCAALGLCSADCVAVLEKLLKQYDLPDDCPFTPVQLVDAARSDKKRSGNSIHLVLPETPGLCRVVKSDFDRLLEITEAGFNYASRC